jgi:hypothetical protein
MAGPRYIDLFIDPNPNTPEGCGQRFKAEGEPRLISRIEYEGKVCEIAGWSSRDNGSLGPAWTVSVEDSSAGIAQLIYGGDWGLRITPTDGSEPFGEPYLLLDRNAVIA